MALAIPLIVIPAKAVIQTALSTAPILDSGSSPE